MLKVMLKAERTRVVPNGNKAFIKCTKHFALGIICCRKASIPQRNTPKEACFVAPQSHSIQSKASVAFEAFGGNLFL